MTDNCATSSIQLSIAGCKVSKVEPRCRYLAKNQDLIHPPKIKIGMAWNKIREKNKTK